MKDDRLYLIHIWNILVHDYLGLDFETVWAAVTNNLPDLKNTVQSALK